MSLDLDVDLLVTEECPVTSLVQRMGRCNRDRNARPLAESGTVLVYNPDRHPAPNADDDLKGVDEFLAATAGKELSQTLLEAVLRAVLASGLEPALGFFHTPRSAAYPLVLDLLELFRTTVWDMPLVGSLNRGQWQPDADFVATKTKVWLSEAGRTKAIGLFEDRLQEGWKHPVLDYSLSYARSIELEARLLEKEWTGEPGLFARSRLR